MNCFKTWLFDNFLILWFRSCFYFNFYNLLFIFITTK